MGSVPVSGVSRETCLPSMWHRVWHRTYPVLCTLRRGLLIEECFRIELGGEGGDVSSSSSSGAPVARVCTPASGSSDASSGEREVPSAWDADIGGSEKRERGAAMAGGEREFGGSRAADDTGAGPGAGGGICSTVLDGFDLTETGTLSVNLVRR